MPDIREVLKALSPEDKTLWTQCRSNMRSVYLNAHNNVIGMSGWSAEDDAFLDLIDIRLALLFDRSGKLDTVKDIIGAEHKEIEQNIHTADDQMKAKPVIEKTAASKALDGWMQ